MYWTQVIVFRLRHSPRDTAQPVIVRLIRAAAEAHGVRKLTGLPSESLNDLVRAIEKVLPVNVLAAFHNSRPKGMPNLYTWKNKQEYIKLEDGAEKFLAEHYLELIIIATYFWARYLSGLNATPHIVEKLDPVPPGRASLGKYVRELIALGEHECFYCGKLLNEPGMSAAVDHFIPWTFVHEDKLWNFVLSCSRCNSSKSDGLPNEDLLERLIVLNKIRSSSPHVKSASFIINERTPSDLIHLYRLAEDEGWPRWQRGQEDMA
jgi:5-methylcytosine-specific restriction endonuclease McrA